MSPKIPNVKRLSHCLSFDDSFLENSREYLRKPRVPAKISAADSMCLSSLVSTQLFSKVKLGKARQSGAKAEFNVK